MKTKVVVEKNGSDLIDMRNRETARKVHLLISQFRTLLPKILTNDLLESATSFPQEYEKTLKRAFLHKKSGLEAHTANPVAINRAQCYISEHLAEPFTLGDVAQSVGISYSLFCLLFKENTGVNFTDFVLHLRVERATQLLRSSNIKISRVSSESGFRSHTYFGQMFRRVVGLSPLKYRRQVFPRESAPHPMQEVA